MFFEDPFYFNIYINQYSNIMEVIRHCESLPKRGDDRYYPWPNSSTHVKYYGRVHKWANGVGTPLSDEGERLMSSLLGPDWRGLRRYHRNQNSLVISNAQAEAIELQSNLYGVQQTIYSAETLDGGIITGVGKTKLTYKNGTDLRVDSEAFKRLLTYLGTEFQRHCTLDSSCRSFILLDKDDQYIVKVIGSEVGIQSQKMVRIFSYLYLSSFIHVHIHLHTY
jgi:hypothetical protein